MDPNIEAPVQQKGIQYGYYGDGRIVRIDHDNGGSQMLLGRLIRGNIFYEDDNTKRFHPRVAAYLKANGVEFENYYVNESEEGVTPPAVSTGGPGQPKPVAAQASIPPPPAKNKRDGDKTPAFVEWMQKYHPEEFKTRYGIQGEGTVTDFRIVRDPEIPARTHREPFRRPALLARRKTHLTDKPDQRADEGYEELPPRESKRGGNA